VAATPIVASIDATTGDFNFRKQFVKTAGTTQTYVMKQVDAVQLDPQGSNILVAC